MLKAGTFETLKLPNRLQEKSANWDVKDMPQKTHKLCKILAKKLELLFFYNWSHLMTSPMDKPIQSLRPFSPAPISF